ncbi:MAG: S-layer homology domain-containing protein [Candidatus Margulisbacteria bacterium]|nr:S-layer homology domain-containing protein [Candidatus Margulisiibacteriota bacterium]
MTTSQVKKGVRVFVFLLIACSLSLCPAFAGSALDPSSTIYNARQLGMGGVALGLTSDGSDLFLNPSALSKIAFPQFTATARKLALDETQYSLAGWAFPTKYGVFGLGFTGLNTGGSIPTIRDPATGRVIQNPSQEVGSFDNSALVFSYARDLDSPDNIAIGGNLKLITQTLAGNANDRATGLTLDLSATYLYKPWLKFSGTLQNVLGGGLSWRGGEDKLGGYYKFSGAVNLLGEENSSLYKNEKTLVAGLGLDLPNAMPVSALLYHAGVEYEPQKNITLRAGLNQEEGSTGLTMGVGLYNSGYRFDYAFVQRPNLPGDNPHYFSLSYVGEKTLTTSIKPIKRAPFLKLNYPPDRLLTDRYYLVVSGEGWVTKVLEKRSVWKVASFGSTVEVQEISTIEPFSVVYVNNVPVKNPSSIEANQLLTVGRNITTVIAQANFEVVDETSTMSAETVTRQAVVLRFNPFRDTPMTYWAIEPIALAVTLGMVKGYPDGKFKPDKGITRAELVTLLVRTLSKPEATLIPYGENKIFKDVYPKHWAAREINYGSVIRYVTGYPDGTFKPNKVLTRAEGVTILMRYAGLEEEQFYTGSPYPDLPKNFWANKNILAAKTAGLLQYLEGKDFKPKAPFTRAEACEVLYRVPTVNRAVDYFWRTGKVSLSQ